MEWSKLAEAAIYQLACSIISIVISILSHQQRPLVYTSSLTIQLQSYHLSSFHPSYTSNVSPHGFIVSSLIAIVRIKIDPPLSTYQIQCLHVVINNPTPIIPLEQFSSFVHLKRVTAWVHRFIADCHCKNQNRPTSLYLRISGFRNLLDLTHTATSVCY